MTCQPVADPYLIACTRCRWLALNGLDGVPHDSGCTLGKMPLRVSAGLARAEALLEAADLAERQTGRIGRPWAEESGEALRILAQQLRILAALALEGP